MMRLRWAISGKRVTRTGQRASFGAGKRTCPPPIQIRRGNQGLCLRTLFRDRKRAKGSGILRDRIEWTEKFRCPLIAMKRRHEWGTVKARSWKERGIHDSRPISGPSADGHMIFGTQSNYGTNTFRRTCQVVLFPGLSRTMPVSMPFHCLPNGSLKLNWCSMATNFARAGE